MIDRHRLGPKQAVQLITREKRDFVHKAAIFHTPHAAAAAVATRRIEKKKEKKENAFISSCNGLKHDSC